MQHPETDERAIISEQQGQAEKDSLCPEENIFAVDEIQIEEMAIDGICGVY